jgi:hypothetical protein
MSFRDARRLCKKRAAVTFYSRYEARLTQSLAKIRTHSNLTDFSKLPFLLQVPHPIRPIASVLELRSKLFIPHAGIYFIHLRMRFP